jgi:hypothetical protein
MTAEKKHPVRSPLMDIAPRSNHRQGRGLRTPAPPPPTVKPGFNLLEKRPTGRGSSASHPPRTVSATSVEARDGSFWRNGISESAQVVKEGSGIYGR